MSTAIPPTDSPSNADEQVLRLIPYPVSSLPSHSHLQGGTAPDLAIFVKKVLSQAKTLIDDLIDAKPTWQKTGSKKFSMKSAWDHQPPSTTAADIDIYKYEKSSLEPKGIEYWVARRSVHKPVSEAGSASFEEFEYGLKTEHSRHEKDYTPDLLHANQVLEWKEARSLELEGYSAITMEIREMVHKIPVFNNRIFPVLVLTAKTSSTSFIVVQIPLSGVEKIEGARWSKHPDLVTGAYTSIENVRVLPNEDIEWIMATASDAKGALPMAIQKPAIPGKIAIDVGLFLKWINIVSVTRLDEKRGLEPSPWYSPAKKPVPRNREQEGAEEA